MVVSCECVCVCVCIYRRTCGPCLQVAASVPGVLYMNVYVCVCVCSTMTKLLDLLEQYLRWRTLPDGRLMQYRRIDGSTPLELREQAIQDFNRPDSDVFIFLLSIRAAGRGLNLQVCLFVCLSVCFRCTLPPS